MGLEYELEVMPFPPRSEREGYLDINSLGQFRPSSMATGP